MMLTNTFLREEETRRRYAVTNLRHNNFGEQATNQLMEKLSGDPNLLPGREAHDELLLRRDGSEAFHIEESVNYDGNIILRTDIGRVEMSPVMAARLRSLYVTEQPVHLLTPSYLSNFSRVAFLLLYRYGYIDPGFKRQGYLAPRYWEALTEAFEMPIDLETFSAPFNTTCHRFCSLFGSLEAPFGSIGSFFDLHDLGEYRLIQMSPPRIGSITIQAVKHAIQLLKTATKVHYIITLTPFNWTDVTGELEDSGHAVWHNNVKRGDTIGYCDVITGTESRYPMPHVCVLSSDKEFLPLKISKRLHMTFSNR